MSICFYINTARRRLIRLPPSSWHGDRRRCNSTEPSLRQSSTRPPTNTFHPGQPGRQGGTITTCPPASAPSPAYSYSCFRVHSMAVEPLTVPTRQLARRPGAREYDTL
eukprot:4331145-Pyramimonas_sp.AAC.1